ncbi:MAG TPA: ABC transporter permease [Candidatus Dormibacteraeota bacterium]|jgi:ABC-2 type transport system permease protein|nr:ABC transporter permease [Candidatus Dormibacteraeota bacterium]
MNGFPERRRVDSGVLSTILLVAGREFTTRVRNRIYVISTILIIAVIGGFALLQVNVFSKINTTPTYQVGFTPQTAALAGPLRSSTSGVDVHVTRVSSLASGDSQVRSGSLDALVAGTPASPRIVVASGVNGTFQSALLSLVQDNELTAELRASGLDPSKLYARIDRIRVPVQRLKPSHSSGYQQPFIGIVMAIALYIFLGVYGQVIGQGVVAEKSSRVVEILLSTVRSGQLLVGKVAGISAVGLLQVAVIAAAAIVFIVPNHIFSLPGSAVGTIIGGVLWFVLGLLLYAQMIAAMASLVSRSEDVTNATLPVMLVLVIGYLLALGVAVPEATASVSGGELSALAGPTTILSMVPFFAPILMPIRIAASAVPAWQIAVAAVLLVACIVGVALTAARIYSNSVLHFGARVNLLEALRGS